MNTLPEKIEDYDRVLAIITTYVAAKMGLRNFLVLTDLTYAYEEIARVDPRLYELMADYLASYYDFYLMVCEWHPSYLIEYKKLQIIVASKKEILYQRLAVKYTVK